MDARLRGNDGLNRGRPPLTSCATTHHTVTLAKAWGHRRSAEPWNLRHHCRAAHRAIDTLASVWDWA